MNAPLPPKLNPNCQCICHYQSGVLHVIACCHAPVVDISQAAVAAALEAGYALGMDAGAWDAMIKSDGDYETPMPDSLKLDALITQPQHDALAAYVAAAVAKARAEGARAIPIEVLQSWREGLVSVGCRDSIDHEIVVSLISAIDAFVGETE